jgi:pimeloyl-ACP methyl ester carboxylesterase
LTDFADRSSAPDFTAKPLFAYPRNAEAAAALNQDRARWVADPTLRRRLRRLAVPALVLHGERDPLPADGAAELARLLSSARLEILPGWAIRPGSRTPQWSVEQCGASSTPSQ